MSAGAEALIGAGAGLLVLPGLGQLQRQVLIRSEPLFIVGMTLCLGASFLAAAAAHRWLGGGRRRDAGAVGVVASLLAGTAWGAVTISGGWGLWQYLPPRSVLWAAALGSAVLAVRTTGVGARLAGALAGVLTMVAVVSATQTGWPLLASSLAADPRPAGAAPVEEVAGALPLAPSIAAGTS